MARAALEEKLIDVNISKPVGTDTMLANMVPLPYSISKEEAVDFIIDNNPKYGFVLSDSDNFTILVKGNFLSSLTVVNIAK